MATRSRTSFQKRQKEIARMEKQRDKAARRAQRKLNPGSTDDDEQLGEGGVLDGPYEDGMVDGVAADGVVVDGVAADGVAADRAALDRVVADRVVADRVVAERVVAERVNDGVDAAPKSQDGGHTAGV